MTTVCSGDTYDRQQDDQMLSGLGTAVTLKSKVNPYSVSTLICWDLKRLSEISVLMYLTIYI